MDYTDDLSDWLSGTGTQDSPTNPANGPSTVGSTNSVASSTSWFDSLVTDASKIGTPVAGILSSLTGKAVTTGTAKNPTVTAASPLLSYIPLAIAAVALILVFFLRRKK